MTLLGGKSTAHPGLAIEEERLSEAWDELVPLFDDHTRETSRWREASANPDRDLYAMADNMGMYRMWIARIDGEPVGYCGMWLRWHPHHKDVLQASCDVLYVHPTRRKSTIALRLIRRAEDDCVRDEVCEIHFSVRPEADYSAMLRRRDYEIRETTWGKVL